MPDSLIIPTSALQAYRRCPKSYELGYVQMLDPIVDREAVIEGRGFHEEMEAYAHERRGTVATDKTGLPKRYVASEAMHDVAVSYIRHKAGAEFDRMTQIIAIEEPLYTRIHPPSGMLPVLNAQWAHLDHRLPDVYVRTTFDLVYQYDDDGDWIAGRDYKSFERAPSYDLDLDFQGRLYIATLMQRYKTDRVRFEYENVRRVPPGTKNSKGVWGPDECYISYPLVISADEARRLWREAQYTVAKILQAMALGDPAAWERHDLKVGPHSCGSCFWKHLCKADMHGTLDEQTKQEFANRRDPLVLPAGMPA